MNKTTLHVWQILLAGMLTVILVGCGLSTPTELPPYIHYKSSKIFNTHLEFDYPRSWSYYEKRRFLDVLVISLEDPRVLTLPTRSPQDNHPTPNDFGYIRILIRESEPGQTPESEVEFVKQTYNKESWRYTVLDSYESTIDGYKASVLEYQDNEPSENYREVMFNRRIYFIVNDQLYEVHFSVAEKDRGGEFEQGYEYFINSLKIIP